MNGFEAYIKERFGIVLPDWVVIEKNGDRFRMMNKQISEEKPKNFVSKGIVCGRQTTFGIKPTSDFIQLFGNLADKNVVLISREEMLEYVKGKDLERGFDFENGYVVLKFEKHVVGVGLCMNGKIKNQVAKIKRI
ncbi:MAG: methyltransferase RsmF C-terminal domain-like protein [Candidatus Anstonellales archaeon]